MLLVIEKMLGRNAMISQQLVGQQAIPMPHFVQENRSSANSFRSIHGYLNPSIILCVITERVVYGSRQYQLFL
jgi:hypothetical protein